MASPSPQGLVTMVCQRCTAPIRLHSSLSLDEMSSIIKNTNSKEQLTLPYDPFTDNKYEECCNGIHVATVCFKSLSESSDVDHPLCSSCPEGAMTQCSEEVRLAEEANDNYRRLLDELTSQEMDSEEMLKIEQELVELKREEEELVSGLTQLQTDVQSVRDQLAKEKERALSLDEEERTYWESFNEHQRQVLELRDQSYGNELQLRYTRDQLDKLKRKSVLNTAFYISHNGHFATINGLRFGKLPSVPVEWSEINTAWGQTALLLNTLANVCSFSFLRYKVIPYGSQSFIQDLREAKKKELPLYSGTRIFSDSKFDLAMVAFLDCLDQFKAHIESISQGRFSLPYSIDKDRIGDGQEYYSIKVQFNSEERWTKALKFTLTNLRWSMTWVSANMMNPLSTDTNVQQKRNSTSIQ